MSYRWDPDSPNPGNPRGPRAERGAVPRELPLTVHATKEQAVVFVATRSVLKWIQSSTSHPRRDSGDD